MSIIKPHHLLNPREHISDIVFFCVAGLYRSVQAHRSQARREGSALQQESGPLGALYDFNLDEELELELDQEAMEAMFTQELATDSDILGMWIPEVLDWPTWVCVTAAWGCNALLLTLTPLHCYSHKQKPTYTQAFSYSNSQTQTDL